MALQGTIKDFALPDIFQLIGIQRKTGVLTLEHGDEIVTIKFLEGQVVGADTHSETIEDRLGSLLVRTGRITDSQLQEALRSQRNTLQRLGYIMVTSKYISEEDLVEALKVQSTQIIYRLFRWREGTYRFSAVEDLDYDQRHFIPISSETILMEGARMIDEWPIIERRIRSARMVLRKTEAAAAIDPDVTSILEEDIDFNLGFDMDRKPDERSAAPEARSGVVVSSEERDVLAYVDGKRNVGEICDLLSIGEFDTYRILSDLMTRNLVEEIRGPIGAQASRDAGWLSRSVTAGAYTLLLGLALAAVISLPGNPWAPWKLAAREEMVERMRLFSSLARLEKIERAVDVFYLDAGTVPKSLAVLAQNGYLKPEELEDPWGRPYLFHVSPGGYQLMGLTGEGEPDAELTFSRSFNATQRLMLAGETRPGEE